MEDKKLDFSTMRYLFPPMHRDGFKFVVIALIAAGVLALLWIPLGILLLLAAYGIFLFFRDPERVPPKDEKAVVSPADGMVCLLMKVPLPIELEPASAESVWRVSVFMSVLDAHVNRMPATGTITKKVYVEGAYLNASLDKASEDNERMLYKMKTADGREMAFVQIAGLVARRIVSFIEEGRTLQRAERFGLIRFGSRLDIYLPTGVEPCVELGQTMVAGETPLARL
jgi:phosphatidylserine decarboxylase